MEHFSAVIIVDLLSLSLNQVSVTSHSKNLDKFMALHGDFKYSLVNSLIFCLRKICMRLSMRNFKQTAAPSTFYRQCVKDCLGIGIDGCWSCSVFFCIVACQIFGRSTPSLFFYENNAHMPVISKEIYIKVSTMVQCVIRLEVFTCRLSSTCVLRWLV